MFRDKMDQLTELIGVTYREIARLAGCSESVFSRLRNSQKIPDRSSTTVEKYINGLYLYCCENGLLALLCSKVDASTDDKESVTTAILSYLFEGMNQNDIPADEFSEKLGNVIKLAGLSVNRLAKKIKTEPATISRMLKGKRYFKPDAPVTNKMCQVIAEGIIERQQLSALTELAHIAEDECTEYDAAKVVFHYLYKPLPSDDVSGISHFFRTLSMFSGIPEIELPPVGQLAPDAVTEDSRQYYYGNEELCLAVTRFLGNAIKQEHKELLLYSDNDTDWMNGDFQKIWAALMAHCGKKGIKIRIIHNIDRSSAEMLTALNNWFPLYMTGTITSYYCTKRRGNRFSHTLFIDKGHACITGYGEKGHSEYNEYEYITDEGRLQNREQLFDFLIENSRELLIIAQEPVRIAGKYTIYNSDNLQICIGKDDVMINKLETPMYGFTITNPILRKAMINFTEQLKEE